MENLTKFKSSLQLFKPAVNPDAAVKHVKLKPENDR